MEAEFLKDKAEAEVEKKQMELEFRLQQRELELQQQREEMELQQQRKEMELEAPWEEMELVEIERQQALSLKLKKWEIADQTSSGASVSSASASLRFQHGKTSSWVN